MIAGESEEFRAVKVVEMGAREQNISVREKELGEDISIALDYCQVCEARPCPGNRAIREHGASAFQCGRQRKSIEQFEAATARKNKSLGVVVHQNGAAGPDGVGPTSENKLPAVSNGCPPHGNYRMRTASIIRKIGGPENYARPHKATQKGCLNLAQFAAARVALAREKKNLKLAPHR